MVATPARIALITTEFRNAIAGPDAGVDAAFGSLARDSDPEEPFETFFDAVADAQAIATARQSLLAATRRRFVAEMADVDAVADLDVSQLTPTAQVIHPERSADLPCAIAQISIDLLRDRASVTLWG